MEHIITKLKEHPPIDELKNLFTKICQTFGECPEDSGLMIFKDDEVKVWVETKQKHLIDKLKVGLSEYSYANGNDYLYALCNTGNDNDEIEYIAMYCIDNPDKLDEIIENLEDICTE